MNQLPTFETWPTHDDALRLVEDCGALQEVENALRQAYLQTGTESSPTGRLRPSRVVEKELNKAGWVKTRPWAPDDLTRRIGESFDGWKAFSVDGTRFGVAVEVEWVWQKVMGDLLKFWRSKGGEQIAVGVVILYGPNSFDYVTRHVYKLYRDLIPDLRVVFCALDAHDLRDEVFPPESSKSRPYLMP